MVLLWIVLWFVVLKKVVCGVDGSENVSGLLVVLIVVIGVGML